MAPFKGAKIVTYHNSWPNFLKRFRLKAAGYIEPKPGIPPTPGHVQEVIQLMKERKIPVLFASNYFDRKQIEQVAQRTGAKAVVVPENTRAPLG